MYQASLKMDGACVGLVTDHSDFICMASDAFEDTQANESVVFVDENDAGDPVECIATALLSPLNGDLIWIKNENKIEIERKTVSMCQMGSMLRDEDRNNCYFTAIKICVQNFRHITNSAPVVLDIGTGTGLLAMMAAEAGASEVIGCEMFNAMADIAADVVEVNGCKEKIRVISMKSVDLLLEEGSDGLADILISELLDSALLGESCLFSHQDAINRLIKPNEAIKEALDISDRVIPHSGSVKASLVESQYLRYSIDLMSTAPEGVSVLREGMLAGSEQSCKGGQRLWPVHWEQVQKSGARLVSEPTEILHVSFYDPTASSKQMKKCESINEFNDDDFGSLACFDTDIMATEDCQVDGLMIWWTVQLLSPKLDPERQCKYSTEPGAQNWQDHWLQCVQPLATPLQCRKGDVIRVTAAHDWVQIWLDAKLISNAQNDYSSARPLKISRSMLSLQPSDSDTQLKMSSPPQCICGWHLLCGGERLQMLNDPNRKKSLEAATKCLVDKLCANTEAVYSLKVTDEHPQIQVVLDTSDGSLLSLFAASLIRDRGSKLKILSKECKTFSNMFHGQLIDANGLGDVVNVWDGSGTIEDALATFDNWTEYGCGENDDATIVRKFNIVGVMSECFFYQLSSQPTWQAVKHYYTCQSILRSYPQALITPRRALVMAAAIELSHLHISHGQVSTVSGFDHRPFQEKQGDWHKYTYPYKLGHYQKLFLTLPTEIARVDFSTLNSEEWCTQSESSFAVSVAKGCCHCVAIWIDYCLIESSEQSQSSGNDGIYLRSCLEDPVANTYDFPLHHTAQLKFFPSPVSVHEGMSLICNSKFS